ncbi:hypothetical protein FQN50_002276 [Emmonsiellopsis sp. PD_5]|nr:hypothetical protein FQN50_002276 [Emmonsiellopsis sp. PD_5]
MAVHAIQAEKIFSYYGLETDPPSSLNGKVDNGLAQAQAVKSLIKSFLEDVGFDRDTPFIKDHDLEAAVWDYFKNLGMGEDTEKSVQKVLKLSVTAYTSLPFDNKVTCATQLLYMFLVDDIADVFMEELRCFGQNKWCHFIKTHAFTLSNGHKHPLLSNFDTHLRSLSRYYGPYCHSAIIKSLFDFANGCIVEQEMRQTGFKLPSESRLMPMFLRTKVGAAEILIHMLWPYSRFPEQTYMIQYFPVAQELALFIDSTNDILSHYKELVINDEKGNLVANFADTHSMSQLDVLRHLTGYTPQLINSVYSMLKNKEELLVTVKNFVDGCIMMCTAHRRYYLVELFEDEQYLPPYDEDS